MHVVQPLRDRDSPMNASAAMTRRRRSNANRSQRDADRLMRVVRKQLQAYADRGVFRGLCELKTPRGTPAFQFTWLIGPPMLLSVDTVADVLRFQRLLPGLPADSPLYSELKMFLRDRHSLVLPAHRRVDRRRAELSCSNRGGVVSLMLKIKSNQYAYGVNRVVNMVHELFVYLRNGHPDYLVESFDAPQE